jgi:hypothetical protein
MNKRIKELAEQAELLGPSSRIGNAHKATERFAELIVHECIAHCTNLDSMQYIAQHFGVKVEGLD